MSQSIMTDQFPFEWQAMRIGDLFSAKAGGDYDPSNSSDVRDNRYRTYAVAIYIAEDLSC